VWDLEVFCLEEMIMDKHEDTIPMTQYNLQIPTCWVFNLPKFMKSDALLSVERYV
jgi:hypothetical protein